jgi:hypothetical protein
LKAAGFPHVESRTGRPKTGGAYDHSDLRTLGEEGVQEVQFARRQFEFASRLSPEPAHGLKTIQFVFRGRSPDQTCEGFPIDFRKQAGSALRHHAPESEDPNAAVIFGAQEDSADIAFPSNVDNLAHHGVQATYANRTPGLRRLRESLIGHAVLSA